MQCRCPGPHEDTIKAGPCACPKPKTPPLDELQAEALDYAVANLSSCLQQHGEDKLCLSCSNRRFAAEALADLRAELHDAEVLILALRAQRDGANNRVKYLEGLIQEIRMSTAKA